MKKKVKVRKVFLILEGKENYKYPVMLVENDLKYLSNLSNQAKDLVSKKYNMKITKAEDEDSE